MTNDPMVVYPFRASFWQRPSIQAMAPLVRYAGPLPQTEPEARRLVVPPEFGSSAYVYTITSGDELDVLYVGKTVAPAARFASHRARKEWWPTLGRVTLLEVMGADRREAEAAALYVESMAIRHLRPIYNLAGVS